MEIEKKFQIDYSGKNPWDQYYDNRVNFDSEEKADAFIQKLMEDENIYQIFKTITARYR
ncbi:hypothetical protein [Jutongia sp.]|uniref:hypothetical protein n=1 Tax=Jutongia sp. TaxID=2944204 RepID=UPI003079541D